jgi:hypothetical protein
MTKLLHRYSFLTVRFFRLSVRVSDPHHFNAGSESIWLLLHFNVDTAPLSEDANLRPLVYRQTMQGSINMHTSIVSVQGHPRLHFELLNFYFNTEPDRAFPCNAGMLCDLSCTMRLRIPPKVDWLVACTELRLVGAVLVVFLRRCTIL